MVSSQTFKGDVVINEISAANSDRILNWQDDGACPTVGAGVSWREIEFDDSAWKQGQGGFGYGDGDDATDISYAMQNTAVSVYLRRTFVVSAAEAARMNELYLSIDYDDGFVAYVNGKEIARKNLGGVGAFAYHDQTAFNEHEAGTPEVIICDPAANVLVPGTNVLAIQAHTWNLYDDDLSLIADLILSGSPAVDLVSHDDVWRYMPGLAEPSGGIVDPRLFSYEAVIPWALVDFDDSSWQSGPGAFGYDYPGIGTDVQAELQNITYSLYIRKTFVVSEDIAAQTDPVVLTVDYDDGFIAYLNGHDIGRRAMGDFGEFFPHDQPATYGHEAGVPETIYPGTAVNLLKPGTNVLAIQTHNAYFASSDLLMWADLFVQSVSNITLVAHDDIWQYFIGLTEPAPPHVETVTPFNDNFIDWIELHNNGTETVALEGWRLTDDMGNLNQWIFPDVSIAPDEYLVILCSGYSITNTQSEYLHARFSLNREGEYLALLNNASQPLFVQEFSPQYPHQSFFHSYGYDALSGNYVYFDTPTPGAKNNGTTFSNMVEKPVFVTPPNFYTTNITVTITGQTPGTSIRYTTDGTEPTLINGTDYTGGIYLNSTRALRARAFQPGAIPSPTVTRTYFVHEPAPVTNITTLCITADPEKSLFKPHGVTAIVGGYWDGSGLPPGSAWHPLTPDDYNIPIEHGRPYERPASLEIHCPGEKWQQDDFGLRIAGNIRQWYYLQDLSGRWDGFVTENKPQFNAFFRSDYGVKTFDYPLVEGSKVDVFDSIRLRSGKNDWKNPFIVDEIARRLFVDMGHATSRGRVASLYVNGEYKAYYNIIERMDERFLQEHHNSNEEWDLVNLFEASEGDMNAWYDMLYQAESRDMNILTNYQYMAGILEMENFIDFLLVETYIANCDWPNNNYFAARERTPNGIFRFYIWDAEVSFYADGLNTIDADAFNEHPVWRPGGGYGLNGETTAVANLYRSLKASPEFITLFADRIQKHYFNNGVLTEGHVAQRCTELYEEVIPQFYYCFPSDGPFDTSARDVWAPNRRPYMFNQFITEGLWPGIPAPAFSHADGYVEEGTQVVISNLHTSGSIYYTTDGTDPRAPGGAPIGTLYTSPVSVTQTVKLRARVYTPSAWSALEDITLNVSNKVPLIVSEIMYNPPNGTDYEFIELKNRSKNILDISDVVIYDGIDFSFSGSQITSLQPDAYIVLVHNVAAFSSVYDTNSILIGGQYNAKLKNEGEIIAYNWNNGIENVSFAYQPGWYPSTDGGGYSLTIADENADVVLWNDSTNWRPSLFINGTPGTDESIPEPGFLLFLWLSIYAVIMNKKRTHGDTPQ